VPRRTGKWLEGNAATGRTGRADGPQLCGGAADSVKRTGGMGRRRNVHGLSLRFLFARVVAVVAVVAVAAGLLLLMASWPATRQPLGVPASTFLFLCLVFLSLSLPHFRPRFLLQPPPPPDKFTLLRLVRKSCLCPPQPRPSHRREKQPRRRCIFCSCTFWLWAGAPMPFVLGLTSLASPAFHNWPLTLN
jgi:hypothetical protein